MRFHLLCYMESHCRLEENHFNKYLIRIEKCELYFCMSLEFQSMGDTVRCFTHAGNKTLHRVALVVNKSIRSSNGFHVLFHSSSTAL